MSDPREETAGKESLVGALLAIENTNPMSPAEARKVAEKALRRARRWVRILTGMTIGFFLLTIVGIGLSAYFCHSRIVPGMAKHNRDLAELERQLTAYEAKTPNRDLLATTARMTAGGGYAFFLLHVITVWGISVLLAVMLAAAVCTVLLVMASRRAALGQIQLGLLVLSEQFDALQRSLESSHSPGIG